jgi:uncharacterized MAPEG superfamily protein
MSFVTHIPPSITALVLYALWTIALVLMILFDRIVLVARGHAKPADFTGGVPHGNPAYWRINRAHMNAVENLPIFAAIVLAGYAAGQESHLFNLLAMAVFAARIVQSLLHIASGAQTVVNLRFTALLVQLGLEIWMAVLILQNHPSFHTGL